MKNYAQADHLTRWDTALAAGAANDTEPTTTDLLVQLGAAATGAKHCLARRASLKYQQQQNSRDLDEFMAAGMEAYSRLALIVKGIYGRSAEKLAEWGMRPFRPALKSKLEPPPLPEDVKQPENGQSPAQAA